MYSRKKFFLFAILMTVVLAVGCGGSDDPSETTTAEPEPVEQAKVEPPPAPVEEQPPPPPTPEPKKEPKPKVEPKPAEAKPPAGPPGGVMETAKGSIKLELAPDRAPATVENFLSYVDDKFYDGTIFHRVISGFMVQGGGFGPDMKEKSTKAPIKNEAKNGLGNLRGTIAMARTMDPHSATAQFYINHRTNRMLDPDQERSGWGYCVFGKVIEGMEVVDAIAAVATGNKGMHQNVPAETVTIKSVRRAS